MRTVRPEALNFANEGKLVIAVAREAAEAALAQLQSHPLGRHAAIIGDVVERTGVRTIGLYGVKRTLDLPMPSRAANLLTENGSPDCG